MNFLRYEPIKTRLRERTLSEREALPYLMLHIGLWSLVMALIGTLDVNDWETLSRTISVPIAVGGVLYVYRQNGGASGHDFVLKYIVLGLIVGVRAFLAAFVVTTALLFYALLMLPEYEGETGPVNVILLLCVEVFVVERIGRHIRDTTGNYEGPPAFVP
jgi:hypothetical protein